MNGNRKNQELSFWQLQRLYPAKVEARTCRSGTDWVGGEVREEEVQRPCQADGWEYTEFTPGCLCVHEHTHRVIVYKDSLLYAGPIVRHMHYNYSKGYRNSTRKCTSVKNLFLFRSICTYFVLIYVFHCFIHSLKYGSGWSHTRK